MIRSDGSPAVTPSSGPGPAPGPGSSTNFSAGSSISLDLGAANAPIPFLRNALDASRGPDRGSTPTLSSFDEDDLFVGPGARGARPQVDLHVQDEVTFGLDDVPGRGADGV